MAAGTKGGGEGLSLSTLIAAALASAAAAVLVSHFSESGSAMAAALTAIFVPLLREAFHRPAQRLTEAPRRLRTASPGLGAGALAGSVRGEAGREGTAATRQVGEGTAATAGGDAAHTHRLAAGEEPQGAAEERSIEGVEPRTNFLAEPDGAPGDMLDPRTSPAAADASPADAETRPLGVDGADAPTRPLANRDPLDGDQTRPLADGDDAPTRPLGGGDTPTGAGGGPGAPSRIGTNGAGLGPSVTTPRRRTFGGRPRWRIALLTGVLAFIVGAVLLTVPELIGGGSIGGGEGRTTLFSGAGDSGSDDAVEDGAIDGDGSTPDGGGDDPSSDPVPGGGGASEDGGAGSSRSGSGSSGGGEGAEGNGDGNGPSAAPQAPSSDDSGSSSSAP